MSTLPIGVFDSGVGGLSVLRELRRLLPREQFLYFADQAHVPHGSRSLDEVRRFCFAITDFLLGHAVKLIVVACNTDSAAALIPLREAHPQTPFVGMEPAIKPAAEESRSGAIGVIATPATFQGDLFANVVQRYAQEIRVLSQTLPGIVERVESGIVDGPEIESLLIERLQPLLDAGIDELVLACTHYPFIQAAIRKVVGPNVKIIDPANAIAEQTQRILRRKNLLSSSEMGSALYFTSGDPGPYADTIQILLGETITPQAVLWIDGQLVRGDAHAAEEERLKTIRPT